MKDAIHILLLSLIILSLSAIQATDIPDWVFDGILKVETRSYYKGEELVYVDRRIGRSGERGPYQMCYNTWKQVAHAEEKFRTLSTDTHYADTCATRYLEWLNKHYAHNNWNRLIEMYHRGPNHHARSYLMLVLGAIDG